MWGNVGLWVWIGVSALALTTPGHLNSATMGEGPLREIIRSCEDDIARFQPAGTSTPVTPGMLSSFSRMTPGAMLSISASVESPFHAEGRLFVSVLISSHGNCYGF